MWGCVMIFASSPFMPTYIGKQKAHAETSRFLHHRTMNWSRYICIALEMEKAYLGREKVTSVNRSALEGQGRTLQIDTWFLGTLQITYMVPGDSEDHIHGLWELCRSDAWLLGNLYITYMVPGDSVSHRHGSWGFSPAYNACLIWLRRERISRLLPMPFSKMLI